MKRTKNFIFILVILISQTLSAQNTLNWNGYAQIRAANNFDDDAGFSLRRLKTWVKSTPEFSENWSYKIQTVMSSSSQETFVLQDIVLGYKKGFLSFDIGQFKPAYSLEWAQSDYNLPIIERANVINTITPNGSLGVRDLGVQINIETKNKQLHSSLGIFNGYGIKEYRFNKKGYMINNKSYLNFDFTHSNLQLGYSFLYRKADNLVIPKVLENTVLFSGEDIRANLFFIYSGKLFEFQSEYLEAYFNSEKASGYYFLANVNIQKSQIMLSFEDYDDLIATTSDNPYLHLGFNYSFNDIKTKLFLDNTVQINNNKIENYILSLQLQLFFK